MKFERQEFLDELVGKVRNGRMTRRTFMERAVALGIGSSAALTLLEACGGSANAGQSTTLTYWNLFGGGDGVRMIQMQGDYSKQFPDVDLQAVTLTWGDPYYTKLAMAAAGGRPPDVAISHITRMRTYAAQGLLEPFDLNELANAGITEDNFLPLIWQRGLYNGQLYAVPLDTHPFVAYYNTEIAKNAGLLDAHGNLKPIQGPDALLNALRSGKEAAGAGGYGVVFEIEGVTPWRLFSTLYSQMGGQVLSPDGKELIMDDGMAEEVLAFMTQITTSKLAAQNIDYAGAVALFGSGKSAFHWNGEWEVTTFVTQKTPFNMVPFPLVYNDYHTQADSHSFVLPRQSAVDPTRRAATLKFISFMLQDSFTWAQGGHVPAYLPVTESAAYKNLKPQSNYASVAPSAVLDPAAWFSGSGSEMENQAGAAFQNALNGLVTPAQGIQQFRTAVESLLAVKLPFA
ncbi:MAG TPA: extracellular solute-binding protein [Ktedonobacteraceae bacterium]